MFNQISKKVKILFLIVFIAICGLVYYQFYYSATQDKIKALDTTALEDQIMVQQSKAAKMKSMQEEIAAANTSVLGEIAVYNNLAGEVKALSEIFTGNVDNINLSWAEPTATEADGMVRRKVSISFRVDSYAKLVQVIESLNTCRYRALIENLAVDSGENTLDVSDTIDVALEMIFFETMDGAKSLAGLTIEKPAQDEMNAIEERAHAYEDQ